MQRPAPSYSTECKCIICLYNWRHFWAFEDNQKFCGFFTPDMMQTASWEEVFKSGRASRRLEWSTQLLPPTRRSSRWLFTSALGCPCRRTSKMLPISKSRRGSVHFGAYKGAQMSKHDVIANTFNAGTPSPRWSVHFFCSSNSWKKTTQLISCQSSTDLHLTHKKGAQIIFFLS